MDCGLRFETSFQNLHDTEMGCRVLRPIVVVKRSDKFMSCIDEKVQKII